MVGSLNVPPTPPGYHRGCELHSGEGGAAWTGIRRAAPHAVAGDHERPGLQRQAHGFQSLCRTSHSHASRGQLQEKC